MLVTHHLLTETPPSPGLARRLQSVCEPLRPTPGRLEEG